MVLAAREMAAGMVGTIGKGDPCRGEARYGRACATRYGPIMPSFSCSVSDAKSHLLLLEFRFP